MFFRLCTEVFRADIHWPQLVFFYLLVSLIWERLPFTASPSEWPQQLSKASMCSKQTQIQSNRDELSNQWSHIEHRIHHRSIPIKTNPQKAGRQGWKWNRWRSPKAKLNQAIRPRVQLNVRCSTRESGTLKHLHNCCCWSAVACWQSSRRSAERQQDMQNNVCGVNIRGGKKRRNRFLIEPAGQGNRRAMPTSQWGGEMGYFIFSIINQESAGFRF